MPVFEKASKLAVPLLLLLTQAACVSFNSRIFFKSLQYRSPDGVFAAVVKYEDALFFMGNHDHTWLFVQEAGRATRENDAVVLFDGVIPVDVNWLSNSKLRIYVKDTQSKVQVPRILGRVPDGLDVLLDIHDPHLNRRRLVLLKL